MTNTQTSASGMSLLPEGTGTITTVHLAIIAVLALVAILGILWGIRQKRTRVQASREVIEHAEEAGVPPQPPADPPETAALRDAPAEPHVQSQSQSQGSPPVAPPSPIADAPVTGAPEPIVSEPIAADFAANPATELAPPARMPVADYAGEPVTRLKGLGPKVAGRLAELGVTTIGQMAALSDDQAESIDAQLGAFTGRMSRDRWIEQARFLAAGDKAGFEAVFGKL